jgi:hypothetical protein
MPIISWLEKLWGKEKEKNSSTSSTLLSTPADLCAGVRPKITIKDKKLNNLHIISHFLMECAQRLLSPDLER